MTDEKANTNGAADPVNALAALWTQCFEQASGQAEAMLSAMRQAGNPEEMHRKWLEAVGQSLDGFMRTPAFLESMRQNLKLMTDLKTMQDQFIQDTGRALGVPLASDIGGLYERLHSHEHAVLSRLDAIEDRLANIEDALENLDHSRDRRTQAAAASRRSSAIEDRLAGIEEALAALGSAGDEENGEDDIPRKPSRRSAAGGRNATRSEPPPPPPRPRRRPDRGTR